MRADNLTHTHKHTHSHTQTHTHTNTLCASLGAPYDIFTYARYYLSSFSIFSYCFFLPSLPFFIVKLLQQGMPLPFPFVDNYADLESEALLVLEPAKKSIARNSKNEELNVMNDENDNILNLNIIQTVQSVLQNPLSSLSEFNWRGERILEQLEKHKVSVSSILALHSIFLFLYFFVVLNCFIP